MTDFCSTFTQRVGYELLLKRIDADWIKHKLPIDDIPIPPKDIPDQQDNELNYLLEADDTRWSDHRPPNFCFEHSHQHQEGGDRTQDRSLDATLRARLAEGREQLIASLEDGTVFSILESLRELQELKENELWALHEKEQAVLRAQACAGHFNVQGIRQSERNMLQRIDKMVEEQQATLIATGLPMFRQSLAPEELSLQMAIIRFITTLGHIYDEEEEGAKEKCGCV